MELNNIAKTISKKHSFYDEVYSVLVSEVGADNSQFSRSEFICGHVTDKPYDEYTFGGKLGYNGRYLRVQNAVVCDNVDYTEERMLLIKNANKKLKQIKEKYKK